MITVTFKPKEHELSVAGHANYAEEGKDIVCAAVSILFYSLVASIEEEMLEGNLTKEIKKGESILRCTPKKGYEGTIELIFWTILNGLSLMAEAYPDYVNLVINR